MSFGQGGFGNSPFGGGAVTTVELGDSTSVSDSAHTELSGSISDSVSTSDSLRVTRELQRTPGDALSVSDKATHEKTISRADSVSVTDDLDFNGMLIRVISDGVAVTDSVTASGSIAQVISARSINPRTVIIVFSEAPNLANDTMTKPGNYHFNGISATRVIGDPTDPNAVRVFTTEQQWRAYTVTVTSTEIDQDANTASFTGFPVSPRVTARAQSATIVTLVFLQPMLANGDLSDPTNYVLKTVAGDVVTVASATPNLVSNPTRVDLEVDPLTSGVPYSIKLDASIQTATGLQILPDSTSFTWVKSVRRTAVPLSKFTGEVKAPRNHDVPLFETVLFQESLVALIDPLTLQPETTYAYQEVLRLTENLTVVGSGADTTTRGAVTLTEELTDRVRTTYTNIPDSRSTVEASFSEGLTLQESLTVLPDPQIGLDPKIASLFGQPDGMVFFTPSLKPGGAPSSSIQVDEVKACTLAYDTYTFPQPIDPKPLMTYGAPDPGVLNGAALIADFYRMSEAKFNLDFQFEETVPPPVDIGATFTFTEETFPPDRVSLLNNPSWVLFDNSGSPPYPFITADNLTPIPTGSVTYRRHMVNPSEILSMTESSSLMSTKGVAVSETMSRTDEFDLSPGEQIVQVNLSETLTIAEGLTAHLGFTLTETLGVTEGLSAL